MNNLHWITELGWAVELWVMYRRWLTLRDIEPEAGDDLYFKTTWVRMCMRLGDSSARHIISTQAAGGKARITDGD